MRLTLFAAVFLASGLAAHAATITYTETVTATGSLNGTAFTNALLTLQATANTASVNGGGGFYSVTSLTEGGSVAGLGSFTLPNNLIFDNGGTSTVGFGSAVLGDILDVSNSFSTTYNLETDITLITGGAASSRQSYPTIGSGNLSISSIGSNATFQAQLVTTPPVAVTPEPSSFALLLTGVAGIGGMLRKRFV